MAHTQPDISIIIVNWNVSELLDICLRSIKQFTKGITYQVIVVDNASSDDSVDMVKRKYPWVTLLAQTDNPGFAKGNNRALPHAIGKHICYLNPDIELIEDALTPLFDYLEKNPTVGIVGPKLLNTDKTHQSSIGNFTKLSNLVREYFLREKADSLHLAHPTDPTTVDVVLGACLMTRGPIAREIGGFDERYFMYHEETDMCLTFLEKGFATVYYPNASMIHHGSKSSTKTMESRQRTLHENRKSQYLFFQKHYGFVQANLARAIILGAMTLRWLPFVVMSIRKPNTRVKAKYAGQTIRWLLSHESFSPTQHNRPR